MSPVGEFAIRVRRGRGGGYDLDLPAGERELLRSLPGQLRELFETAPGDPAVGRLFPPAYEDDPQKNAEYEELTRNDLVSGRLGALRVMEETAGAEHLEEEQLAAWLGAVNDLRLVLGTRLDVTEETYERPPVEKGPDAEAFAVFVYLGMLEEQIVEALATSLDQPGPTSE